MIGIIYKFTILAKVRYDGHKPFYIGQHWCKSKDDFLCRDYPYYGSGTIWHNLIEKLRKLRPNNWKSFIKREVLYSSEVITQRGLNGLEKFYIRKYKSLYSEKLGGTNIIEGASIEINPASCDIVRKKMRIRKQEFLKSERALKWKLEVGNRMKKYVGELNPSFGTKWITNGTTSKRIKSGDRIPNGWCLGNHWVKGENNPSKKRECSKEERMKRSKKMKGRFAGNRNPMYGRKLSSETKYKISETIKRKYKNGEIKKVDNRGCKNPMYGKHHTEETKMKIRLKHLNNESKNNIG